MEYLLSTSRLTKQYKTQKAVDDISLHVKRGDIYGFIGRNGAGKTTFMRLISGLASPTSGDFSLFGFSGNDLSKVLSRIGTLIESPGLYPNITAYDNLKLKCICSGIKKANYIEGLLELVGLSDVGNKKVKNFSLGMKQRLGIAVALIGEPDLLVLDEPINGLDPQGIVEVRNLLLKLNKEKNITIIISSHILEELTKIATNYGIIHEGKLIQELTKDELMAKCCERIEIKLPNPEQACVILDKMNITDYKVVDKNTIHIFERLDESSEINMELSKNNLKITSIGITSEALEDYFLNLTGGANNA